MAIYDHACIREMVFIALLEGIQIDKLLFDESREEQARLQENIQLAVYLQMNEFQTALLIDPKMISFLGIMSELIHIKTNIFFWGHNMERILLWPFSFFGR